MFSGLKKRVSSVLAEGRILSETLSNTYIRQNSSSTTTTTVGITSPAATPTAGRNTPTNVATATALASDFPHQLLNASAGVSQLASQELAWQQIHAGTVANAAAADACDAQIQLVRSQTERSAVAVSDMQHSLCAVPAISRQLIECRQMLGDIGELCGRIELGLHGLEDVLEELELQERQLQLNIDLAVYRDGKMGDLEKVRTELVGQYATKQRQQEQRLRNVQQERQAVFQEAFQADLNCYRTLGTIPKVERTRSEATAAIAEVTLEEIVLDTVGEDTQKLDEFLNN